MKAKRILFLVMAICLASGVEAQFYDGPDEIYYYVQYEYERNHNRFGHDKRTIQPEEARVMVFNFDGIKAAGFWGYAGGDPVTTVKSNLRKNPSYYENEVETNDYEMKYYSTTGGETIYINTREKDKTYCFLQNRNLLYVKFTFDYNVYGVHEKGVEVYRFKRVDKSYFKSGRSRTPSGTMYE